METAKSLGVSNCMGCISVPYLSLAGLPRSPARGAAEQEQFYRKREERGGKKTCSWQNINYREGTGVDTFVYAGEFGIQRKN